MTAAATVRLMGGGSFGSLSLSSRRAVEACGGNSKLQLEKDV